MNQLKINYELIMNQLKINYECDKSFRILIPYKIL